MERWGHGTLTNMEPADWVPGIRGPALDCDGVNEFVSISNWDETKIDKQLSVSIWLYPHTSASPEGIIGSIPVPPTYAATDYNWLIRFSDANGSLQFRAWNPAGENMSLGAGLNLGSWNHLVVTVDIGGSGFSFYIDGVFIGADTAYGIASLDNTNNSGLHFGTYENSEYDGLFDSVLVYDRVLTSGEIEQLYSDPYCFMRPPVSSELWYVAVAANDLLLLQNSNLRGNFNRY
jgi:hypothetical protein